jgi:hypothetical protein
VNSIDLKDKETFLNVLLALLWAVITILGATGHYLAGMLFGVVLMLIYMMLGASKNGKLNKDLFIYPLLAWAVLWILSFILSDYYSAMFAGKKPDFTILGLHPSFAWTVLTYWIGGMVTLGYGFRKRADCWLSDEDWKAFKEKIAKLKGTDEVSIERMTGYTVNSGAKTIGGGK